MICLVLAVIGAIELLRLRTTHPVSASALPSVRAIRSIAVLPFKPIIAKERDEALQFGIADTLIAKISNIRGITVRPLTAVRRYAGPEQDAVEAGRQLGVEAVLDGTTHNANDKIRVTARLLRVSDSSQLWSVQFDTTLADIFSIYDAISSRLVEEFSLQLTAVEQRELRKRDTQNPDAYRAYLLGRYYQSKLGRENLEKAIDYFKQAVSLDPEYALAYVGLASVDIGLPIGADYPSAGPAEAAKAAATKAIALDPALADAYAQLGFVKFWYEWDWPAAEELYRKAIALNPNDSSAHLYYGVVLSIEGHNAEAEREVEIARRIDPLSMQMNIITAQTYMQAHHFDAAEAQLKRALQISPNAFVPHLILGKTYERKQMYDQALEHYRISWSNSFGETEPLGRIGHLLALRGESAKAREVLEELTRISKTRYVPPYNIALVHAGLDEKDKAFRLLDRGCQERDVRLVFLRVDPVWDPLRSDPRFRNILSCTHQEP